MRTRETKQKRRRFWCQNTGPNILDLCVHDLPGISPSVFAGVSEGAQLWYLYIGLSIEELQLQVPLLYPPKYSYALGQPSRPL